MWLYARAGAGVVIWRREGNLWPEVQANPTDWGGAQSIF